MVHGRLDIHHFVKELYIEILDDCHEFEMVVMVIKSVVVFDLYLIKENVNVVIV